MHQNAFGSWAPSSHGTQRYHSECNAVHPTASTQLTT